MDYYNELLNKNENIYPIKQIINTYERNYNLERLTSLKSLKDNLIYKSVLKNLEILNKKDTKFKNLISEVLIWSDVSKVGTKEERAKWKLKGYDMFVHNLASAEIYKDNTSNFNERVYILIKTHGLIVKYIKGEVPIDSNKELYSLIKNKLLEKSELKEILYTLNECLVKEISEKLYDNIKSKIENVIDKIINNEFDEDIIIDRFKTLNRNIDKKSIETINGLIKDLRIYDAFDIIFSKTSLWYYNSALNKFSIEEQLKILLIISNHLNTIKNINFCPLMKNLYFDSNIKKINLYKLYIIKKYLSTIEFDEILNLNIKENPNIGYSIQKNKGLLEFNFEFSQSAIKLIEYCELSNIINKKNIDIASLIYDLFGFKKDKYDKLYDEINNLIMLNNTVSEQSKVFEFIKGSKVLDVGPGSGFLMDLILQTFPNKEMFALDISNSVIDKLKKKSLQENKKYNLIKGNVINLDKYYQKNSIDTIIFSSLLHEIFSCTEYDKKKFNIDVVIKILKSAYEILSKNGRIIIRDEIKSDKNVNRIIEFKNKNDLEILKKYLKDFKGRNICYKVVNDSTVIMPINDAMEFLHSYACVNNSYSSKVQKQYGYFTPKEYESMITNNLPNSKIIYSRAYLEESYKQRLQNKINFYDEKYNTVDLPNNIYILVIEKEL